MRSTLFKAGGLILFMAASSAAFGQCTVPPCSNIDKQVMGSRWPAFGIDSGAANAYAVTTTAALGPSLRTGSKIMFFATHANTTASTLAVNGGSAIAIKKNVSIALSSGDILLNGLVEVVYDGTNFQMLGPGTTNISLPLSVANGGTGLGTLTAHAALLGEGTSNVGFAPVVGTGNCLMDNGLSSDPTFQTCAGGSGGVVPCTGGAGLAASYASTLLAEGSLVNYWKMDEAPGATSIADSKGSNTGTVSGGVTFGNVGCLGNGALFNGSSGLISVTRSIQDDFTIELWMKSTVHPGCDTQFFGFGQGLVGGEVAGVTNDFGVIFADYACTSVGNIVAGTGNPDTSVGSTAVVNDGNWHYVVFTRKKSTGTISLYVDNVLNASTGAGTQTLNAASTLFIGADPNFYSGYMQQLAFYSSALGTTQINAHWLAAGGTSNGGTITQIDTGTGLTGGPITGSGTISLQTPVSLANGGTHADLSATGGASKFLKQASSGADVTVVQPNDADISFSDITTGNSATGQHGFLKKLDNVSTHFMDGTGGWSTPPGSGGGGSATSGPALGALVCSSSQSANGPFTCGSRFAVITGKVLIGICGDFTNGAGAGTPAFSDTLSNTWTQIGTVFQAGNSRQVTAWWSNPSTGGSDTFTCSNSVTISFGGMSVSEVSGATTAGPVDATTSTTGNNSSFDLKLTTVAAGDLMFVGYEYGGTLTDPFPTSPTPFFNILADGTIAVVDRWRDTKNAGDYYIQGNISGNYAILAFGIK